MMGFLKNLFFDEKATWHEVNKIIRSDPKGIAKKWIYVYYSIYLSKNNEKKAIEQAAVDMALIINNTKAIFLDQNEEFLGCINPYIGINSIILENELKNTPQTMLNLEKHFKCSVEELPDQWHIVIHPIKENSDEIDLYSLERLCSDMYILGHASDYISGRYSLVVHNKTQSTMNPEMIKDERGDDVPCITHFTRLLVYRYPIKERFEFQKEKPFLDTWLFGAGRVSFNDQIDKIRNTQPTTEWTKKVNEIVGDTKK